MTISNDCRAHGHRTPAYGYVDNHPGCQHTHRRYDYLIDQIEKDFTTTTAGRHRFAASFVRSG
jgi:hypothetical protein